MFALQRIIPIFKTLKDIKIPISPKNLPKMDFYSLEAQDAIRFSWNNLPSSKITATRAVLPLACLYSPMKDLENLPLVEYDPLKCKCGSVLNPCCQVDFRTKIWICPLCGGRNTFPPHYAEYISESNLPAELMQQYSTIEYLSTAKEVVPNVMLFLIDTCLSAEELNAVRDSIQQSLNIIPAETYVGLVTFGRFVFVHELGFTECPKSYVFNGVKEYTPMQIQEQLGIAVRHDPRGAAAAGGAFKRFLLPLSECEFTLNSILDDLQPDPWVVPGDERPLRATGSAYNVAISLLEACPFMGGRILSFLGGPCTLGAGTVVGPKLEEIIRSYLDMQKDNENCKYFKKAQKYYQTLSQRAIKASQVIDIFAFTLDQFGLLEMRHMSEKTGGYIVVNESFISEMFKDSYKKIFERDANGDLKFGTAGKIDIFLSKDLRVNGAIGACTSLKKNGPLVGETEVGQGGTTSWYMGGIDRSSTIAFYLDLAAQQANKEITPNKVAYFQFQTIYKGSNGKMRLRVTTLTRRFADSSSLFDLAQGFDQEAACVVMARLGVVKAEAEEPLEVLKWLDRSLIRVVCRFAEYKKDDLNSFRLNKEFSLYPQFMYHLRRSHFLQTFGASPDEATFYRVTLIRENTTNSLVMIQPALLEYSLENIQPSPVLLDIESLKNNVILLLDTYFHVVVWSGTHIAAWREAGYQEKPEYENFKDLLNAPMEDVKLILEDRFPVPTLIICDQGNGKERYLKSKVNPSMMDSSNPDWQGGNYITDDASLKVFMDHLIKLAVQSSM